MVQISCDLSIPTKPSKGNENGRQMSKVFTVSYPTAIIPRHFRTSQVSQINLNSSVCFKSLKVWATIKLRRKTTLLGWCLLNTSSKRSRTSLMLSLSLVLITFYIFLDPVTEYVNKPKFSTLTPKKKNVCGGGWGEGTVHCIV